jgi:hypothetical protein
MGPQNDFLLFLECSVRTDAFLAAHPEVAVTASVDDLPPLEAELVRRSHCGTVEGCCLVSGKGMLKVVHELASEEQHDFTAWGKKAATVRGA